MTSQKEDLPDIPIVPASWGEVIDKITILEIKVARLPGEAGRANAARELALLQAVAEPALARDGARALATQLKTVNEALWEIEDSIRDHERAGQFDAAFIALARSVYKRNDERGAVKRELNRILDSKLVEEKGYKPY
jgi:hypothetical protein